MSYKHIKPKRHLRNTQRSAFDTRRVHTLGSNRNVVTLFRKYPDGSIVALFPDHKGKGDRYCQTYMHFGKDPNLNVDVYMHSMNFAKTMRLTVPASPVEYEKYKRDLEANGYSLIVKTTPR